MTSDQLTPGINLPRSPLLHILFMYFRVLKKAMISHHLGDKSKVSKHLQSSKEKMLYPEMIGYT